MKHKFYLSKSVCGMFHFCFRFLLLKISFLFNKEHEFFNFKTLYSKVPNKRVSSNNQGGWKFGGGGVEYQGGVGKWLIGYLSA